MEAASPIAAKSEPQGSCIWYVYSLSARSTKLYLGDVMHTRSNGEGKRRELASFTGSMIPQLSRPMGECSGRSVHKSYNTFVHVHVPHYTIDSEYLKTLLVGKFLPCELGQPTLFQSSFVSNFQQVTPSDSGIQSAESDSSSTLNSATDNTEADYFRECELQLHKLFQFVEQHLSLVESELESLTMAPRQVRNRVGSAGSEACSDEEEEKVDEVTPLTGQIQQSPDKITVLTRLLQILNSLKESIVTSFNRLIEMHDDSTTSLQGKQFLEQHTLTKMKLERRIASDLDEIESTFARDDWVHVSHKVSSQQADPSITEKVRKYRPGCVTLLHVLVFIAAWCGLCFMYYNAKDHATWAVTVRLLRSPFLIVFYFYLYGINIKAWANVYIDYVGIFGFPVKGIYSNCKICLESGWYILYHIHPHSRRSSVRQCLQK